jgi:hypothetical protein
MFVSMPSKRALDELRLVFTLRLQGLTDREISRQTGIPVTTIRTWRNGRLPLYAVPHVRRYQPVEVPSPRPADLPEAAYAYLLGVYLGDGWLSRNGRSWLLRVVLDSAYPKIVDECCGAIDAISGKRPIPKPHPRGQRCVLVGTTWFPWFDLFPQHGPGKKHHRKIALTEWQEAIVGRAPKPFLRGLIHTDGWRGLNRVHTKGKDYAYPRYQFSNRSGDIRKLFTDACDLLGIEWTRWTRYHVSVARRKSVALMDTFIGPKE